MADLYGTDVSTYVDQGDGTHGLDPLFAPMSGPRAPLEVFARALETPSGLLRDAPGFGYDLTTRVGARVSSVGRERMKARIEAQGIRDERIRRAKVTAFSETTPGAYELAIAVELAAGEKFDLVLSVSAVGVDILRISQANG